MKVLHTWLQEFARLPDDIGLVADTMSALGLAVEEVLEVGQAVDGVLVARVLALRPHPSADRIQLVDVDAGDGTSLQVCCGAFNMAVGDLVPLATIGTVMPGGMEIARRKLRGEWSNGMLCAPDELGLGDEHDGILILPADLEVGAPVFEALGVRPEVVYDLDLTRNRPDAWSHRGVARDVAAQLGLPFTDKHPVVEPSGPATGTPADILAPELCGRFTATVLTGVEVGPSPRWLASRLAQAGMRPISNVVDVSNYVMLELGQPNHPYDLQRLPGQAFRIRRAHEGESMVTLDDVERTFTGDDLLICDGTDAPIGIAGIMGGASSEIHDGTTEVALEMAWFQPLAVAATAARLGLRTEASARFERGVDPFVIDAALGRFVELLRETSPRVAVAPGAVDARGVLPEPITVGVRTARVNRLLGIDITDGDIKRLLEPMGFAVGDAVADGVQPVTIPSWRPDCAEEIDILEEVARQYGYERIAKTVPPSAHPGGLTPLQQDRRRLRHVMVGIGLSEAMPTPLVAPGAHARAGLEEDAIALANPMVTEESLLRSSLRPGLLQALAYNESHRNTGVGLFELGHVYRRPTGDQPLPDERELLTAVRAGADAWTAAGWWRELADALALDGVDVEAAERPGLHPTRTARLVAGGTEVGVLGEIDPAAAAAYGISERVAVLEVDLEHLLALDHGNPQYRRVSRYPSSDLDLAFTVPDELPAAEVARALRDATAQAVSRLELFDVYRGPAVAEGYRSLAYRLRLQATDRTLTDADVADVRAKAVAAAARVGAELRGASSSYTA
jgi:phenylalanyl-tRNA synthetase beta chain